MTRTIVRLFDDREDAMDAADELHRMGIPDEDVSIVAKDEKNWFDKEGKVHRSRSKKKDRDGDGQDDRAEGAAKGAMTGGALGAGAGVLAGLGLLAIPGLGPVVAAGWLASTATGAAAGALAGGALGGLIPALQKEGVSEEDAHVYSEGVKRGGTLLTVRVPDNRADVVEAALIRFSPVSIEDRGAQYRTTGWTGFRGDTTSP